MWRKQKKERKRNYSVEEKGLERNLEKWRLNPLTIGISVFDELRAVHESILMKWFIWRSALRSCLRQGPIQDVLPRTDTHAHQGLVPVSMTLGEVTMRGWVQCQHCRVGSQHFLRLVSHCAVENWCLTWLPGNIQGPTEVNYDPAGLAGRTRNQPGLGSLPSSLFHLHGYVTLGKCLLNLLHFP